MNLLECLATALASLSQNKVRSFLTTLGVIIGVMSVILLIALGEAAQAYIRNQFAGMGSNVLLITPGKQETTGMVVVNAGSFHKLSYRDANEIERKGVGIRGMSANVFGAAQIRYLSRQRDCLTIGCTPDLAMIRDMKVRLGRFIEDRDVEKNSKVCVIGDTVRRELFGSAPAVGESISVNRSKHMIVGVIEPKGMMLNVDLDDIVLIPLPSGQKLFHGGEDVLFEIVLSARSPEDIKQATASAREILIAAHDHNEDFTITDQDGMIGSFDRIFNALRTMLLGIACISLVVGGIGIMNIMLVSVRERTREVGIRKAIGAKRRDIGLQFLAEAVTLSMFGGLMGIALGWLTTVLVRHLYPTYPVFLSGWSVLMSFVFSLTVGIFFGVYPAVKASGVDPVEALRYE